MYIVLKFYLLIKERLEIGLQKHICMYKVIHVVEEGKLWNMLLDRLVIKIGTLWIRVSGKALGYTSKATGKN